MHVLMLDGRAEQWVRVVVTRDPVTATRWRGAVEGAGVASETRIEDALEAAPGTSTLGGALPDLQPFVYSLYVPRDVQDAARAALIEAGWNGRTTGPSRLGADVDSRVVLRGAAVALALGTIVVLLRVVLG